MADPPDHALRRVGVPAAVSVILAWAALRAMGPPDLRAGLDFFTGGYPTTPEAIAAAEVVLWLLVAGVSITNVVAAIMPARGALRSTRLRRRGAVGVLVIGALIFTAGVVRHSRQSVDLCCGSVDEASQLAR